jgi:hypothetical protein
LCRDLANGGSPGLVGDDQSLGMAHLVLPKSCDGPGGHAR